MHDSLRSKTLLVFINSYHVTHHTTYTIGQYSSGKAYLFKYLNEVCIIQVYFTSFTLSRNLLLS